MKITKKVMCGSVESGDILVTFEPSEKPGLEIKLTSTFAKQFHDNILEIVQETLKENQIDQGVVILNDQGALPGAIKARVLTAIQRMGETK